MVAGSCGVIGSLVGFVLFVLGSSTVVDRFSVDAELDASGCVDAFASITGMDGAAYEVVVDASVEVAVSFSDEVVGTSVDVVVASVLVSDALFDVVVEY